MAADKSLFLRQHLLYPFFFLMAASSAIVVFNIDMRLEDYFYSLQGHSWSWKNSWLIEKFIHRGGRALSISLAVTVLVLLLLSVFLKSQVSNRKPLLYLFCAVAGGSLLVSLLKASLDVSCPWEFQRYGGTQGYLNVIQQLYLRNGEGCFPAAHASAGYAWVALYFFGLFFQSQIRWTGLAIALVAGLIFGFAQQVRGAHFLSHDLWSLAVCWFYCLALYLFFSRSTSRNYIRVALSANNLSRI